MVAWNERDDAKRAQARLPPVAELDAARGASLPEDQGAKHEARQALGALIDLHRWSKMEDGVFRRRNSNEIADAILAAGYAGPKAIAALTRARDEALRYNTDVKVCQAHTAEVRGNGCLVCERDEAQAELAFIDRTYGKEFDQKMTPCAQEMAGRSRWAQTMKERNRQFAAEADAARAEVARLTKGLSLLIKRMIEEHGYSWKEVGRRMGWIGDDVVALLNAGHALTAPPAGAPATAPGKP